MVFDLRPVGLRARLCRAVAAATALALTAAGCSYHSEYVAPQDGRARVIWGSGDVPEAEMSGAQLSSDCQAAVYGVIDDSHAVQSSARVEVHSVWVSPRSGYWAPRYYGPPIVVVQPGFAPPLPRAAVFVPRSAVPMGGHPIIVRSPGGGGGGGGHISGAASRGGSGGSSGGSSKSGGGGGSGGGNGLGAVVVVLAVIALTTLPIVALGFAASMPESSGKSSSAIDTVNAFNDLARSDGTLCMPMPYAAAPAGYPPPQEQPQ